MIVDNCLHVYLSCFYVAVGDLVFPLRVPSFEFWRASQKFLLTSFGVKFLVDVVGIGGLEGVGHWVGTDRLL